MRELRRKFRVAALRAKRNPMSKFYIILLAAHVGFVVGYATMTVLQTP